MSWENEDVVREHIFTNTFAGEDEDAAIPDSWDAEEEPVQKQPEPVKKVEAPKSKLLKKELKEKEMKKKLDDKPLISEKERQNFEKDMEYELFKDTLEIKPKVVEGIDNFQVKTKEDFEKLKELLKKKILPLESNPNYNLFLESIFRDLVISSDVGTLKKLSIMFSALANEKSKIQKTTGKKKKASKGAKLATYRENDVTNYDDDDDLDFDEDF